MICYSYLLGPTNPGASDGLLTSLKSLRGVDGKQLFSGVVRALRVMQVRLPQSATFSTQISIYDLVSLCTLYRLDFRCFIKSRNRGYTM